MANTKHTFALHLEWLDPASEMKRPFKLFVHVRMDEKIEIEIHDTKNRKTFLKRILYPSLEVDDLFIGAKLNIYGRQMTVLDYDNDFTRKALEKMAERCFGMLNSSAMGHLGQVWAAVNAAGLRLTNLRTVRLSSSDASNIFDVCPAGVVDTLSAAFEIVGPSATAAWNDVVEGLSSSLPSSAASGLIGAASETESERCLGAFFGGGYQGRASRPPQFGHTAAAGFAGSAGGGSSPHSSRAVTACMDPYVTTVVVLPHIVKRGAAGHVLQHLQAALASEQKEPLAITAMQMFDLELITAEEFLEVYQHVAPEYGEMTAELSSGLCLAIEVRGADAVARIRHICGPRDVDIAKQIRPESIRAKHGASTVQNAVHCTDLDEDGATESEYFFNVLQK